MSAMKSILLAAALGAALSLSAGTRADAAGASAAPPSGQHLAPAPVLPFIEDDYPRALAEARAKKLPIFIDAWAPW